MILEQYSRWYKEANRLIPQDLLIHVRKDMPSLARCKLILSVHLWQTF